MFCLEGLPTPHISTSHQYPSLNHKVHSPVHDSASFRQFLPNCVSSNLWSSASNKANRTLHKCANQAWCANCFTRIDSLVLITHMRWGLSLCPFYKWGHWSSEQLVWEREPESGKWSFIRKLSNYRASNLSLQNPCSPSNSLLLYQVLYRNYFIQDSQQLHDADTFIPILKIMKLRLCKMNVLLLQISKWQNQDWNTGLASFRVHAYNLCPSDLPQCLPQNTWASNSTPQQAFIWDWAQVLRYLGLINNYHHWGLHLQFKSFIHYREGLNL